MPALPPALYSPRGGRGNSAGSGRKKPGQKPGAPPDQPRARGSEAEASESSDGLLGRVRRITADVLSGTAASTALGASARPEQPASARSRRKAETPRSKVAEQVFSPGSSGLAASPPSAGRSGLANVSGSDSSPRSAGEGRAEYDAYALIHGDPPPLYFAKSRSVRRKVRENIAGEQRRRAALFARYLEEMRSKYVSPYDRRYLMDPEGEHVLGARILSQWNSRPRSRTLEEYVSSKEKREMAECTFRPDLSLSQSYRPSRSMSVFARASSRPSRAARSASVRAAGGRSSSLPARAGQGSPDAPAAGDSQALTLTQLQPRGAEREAQLAIAYSGKAQRDFYHRLTEQKIELRKRKREQDQADFERKIRDRYMAGAGSTLKRYLDSDPVSRLVVRRNVLHPQSGFSKARRTLSRMEGVEYSATGELESEIRRELARALRPKGELPQAPHSVTPGPRAPSDRSASARQKRDPESRSRTSASAGRVDPETREQGSRLALSNVQRSEGKLAAHITEDLVLTALRDTPERSRERSGRKSGRSVSQGSRSRSRARSASRAPSASQPPPAGQRAFFPLYAPSSSWRGNGDALAVSRLYAKNFEDTHVNFNTSRPTSRPAALRDRVRDPSRRLPPSYPFHPYAPQINAHSRSLSKGKARCVDDRLATAPAGGHGGGRSRSARSRGRQGRPASRPPPCVGVSRAARDALEELHNGDGETLELQDYSRRCREGLREGRRVLKFEGPILKGCH